MLFSKSISDLTHEDVEEFCKRFREGLRVEYKSTFDVSVKNKLSRVVASFANSYGGILLVGVNTNGGTPVEPFDGIEFEDREPRLTVENICRSDIFPEVVIYQNLIPSRVSGKAFLAIQVNESPRTPHAIENSTRVYVRTGDSANPTTLADVMTIERLLLRRREVQQRWSEFYTESDRLADAVGLARDVPLLDLRVGPLYPTEIVISREKIFQFLNDLQLQNSIRFQGKPFRHPSGALLSRSGDSARYLCLGELGAVHYLEPLEAVGYNGTRPLPGNTSTLAYPFWWVTSSLLRIVDVASALMRRHGPSCDLRIETKLVNVAKLAFTLASDGHPYRTLPVSTLSPVVPAAVVHSSETLSENAEDIAVELLYQLRWPFGTEEPHTRDQIRPIVARVRPEARVRFS